MSTYTDSILQDILAELKQIRTILTSCKYDPGASMFLTREEVQELTRLVRAQTVREEGAMIHSGSC